MHPPSLTMLVIPASKKSAIMHSTSRISTCNIAIVLQVTTEVCHEISLSDIYGFMYLYWRHLYKFLCTIILFQMLSFCHQGFEYFNRLNIWISQPYQIVPPYLILKYCHDISWPVLTGGSFPVIFEYLNS